VGTRDEQRLQLDFSINEKHSKDVQPPPAETKRIHTGDELRQREIDNIIVALQQCNGRLFGRQGAAELLEMKPTTLVSRIKRLGINRHQYIS